MKKVILLALLMPGMAFGQIVENFESGTIVNWTESITGHWIADTASSISGKYALHHVFDNPDAGTDCIGISLKNLHPSEGVTKWSFLVRYGYDPSSLNNWSAFLLSDNNPSGMALTGAINGYAIGVNLSGSDDTLRLWKVNGNSFTSLINSHINWQTDIGTSGIAKISVQRTKEGVWTIDVSNPAGNKTGSGSATSKELSGTSWFGIYYRYSSTRDRLLWLDNISIEGVFYDDITAPSVTKCEVSGKNSVEITLSEEPASGFSELTNISLNDGENRLVSVSKKNSVIYTLVFEKEFINRSVNSLNFIRICDNSGNCADNVKVSFTPVRATAGDVVITEIMADPTPRVSLPDKEFIEITNRTVFPLNLKNWRLSITGQASLFPEVVIQPSGIIILCSSQDTSYFSGYGKVLGLKQFPVLTDGGRLILISDSTGKMIHGVEYSQEWYGDELKSQGGWTLEMIDTRFPFYERKNWTASVSRKGGTPGSINAVSSDNPDPSFHGLVNVFPEDSVTVKIKFSEPVFKLQDILKDIRIDDMKLIGLYSTDPLFRSFYCKIESPLRKDKIYSLQIPEIVSDFAGNLIQKSSFNFGLTQQAAAGDILFNEILFNPLPGDPDYLELFNSSEKIINLARLQIVSQNDDTGDKSELVRVSEEDRCFLPGEYYAITTDAQKTEARYFSTNPDFLFETESLPSMPDDKGHIILYNMELDKLDELIYNDDMHYSLLSVNEGVSLEKIDPAGESGEKGNWHSASGSAGWGTPGAPNSVYSDITSQEDNVVLSSTKISPDNDGFEDLLSLKMAFRGTGNVVSVSVFDETGSLVKKITVNQLAGSEATFIWDGTASDGSLVRTGIYIILINMYNDSGRTRQWKKVCTVVMR
jgi:hypothetical protein